MCGLRKVSWERLVYILFHIMLVFLFRVRVNLFAISCLHKVKISVSRISYNFVLFIWLSDNIPYKVHCVSQSLAESCGC